MNDWILIILVLVPVILLLLSSSSETKQKLLSLVSTHYALPVRIAVVTGQIQVPPTCGVWCYTTPDPASPCTMDEDVVPCKTDFYCTTTCALWSRFTGIEWNGQVHLVPCLLDLMGIPRITMVPSHATRCAFCPKSEKSATQRLLVLVFSVAQTGTCYASASSMAHLAEVAAVLECPCNWFGADCPDDWAPVQAIN